jgi:hypothetical protein
LCVAVDLWTVFSIEREHSGKGKRKLKKINQHAATTEGTHVPRTEDHKRRIIKLTIMLLLIRRLFNEEEET